MLVKLLKGLARRGSAEAQNTPLENASAFLGRATALESTVARLCAAGDPRLAFAEVLAGLPSPGTTAEAQRLMRTVVVPLLEACERIGNADLACRIEQDLHQALVKRFEDQSHFEACMSMIDGPLYRLGKAARLGIPDLEGPANRILFFVHNLATDFAHTNLMCDLINAFLQEHPSQASCVGIAGAAGNSASPGIEALRQRHGVAVHILRSDGGLYDPILAAAGFLAAGQYDRIVILSLPVSVSFFTGLLPPSRLAWLTMKYQLSSFDRLAHRCSFRSGLRREIELEGRRWFQAPPLFADHQPLRPLGDLSPVLQAARRFGTVLYTINREEKIRNPQFLHRVTEILKRVDDAVFVWTGRSALPEISDHFADHGLADRHTFAGWVVPDDLLQVGDLFLDTPVLSGNVAARATALGRAVVTDADAITWVGTFLPVYDTERGSPAVSELDLLMQTLEARGIRLQCRGDDEFIRQSAALATDPALRAKFSQTLQAFASRYFFNATRSAEDHFANLRAPIG
jgi:hypothetical protein